MDCIDYCLIGLSPPTLPPPPPIPSFIAYLNLTIDCGDLCSWAGVAGAGESSDGKGIHLSSLLIVVGVISACFGAGIMAAILSIKRIRGFSSSSTSVRHLARKCEESNATGSASVEGFSASAFSENTYCEGPQYSTSDKDSSTPCNIYAELHPTPLPGNAWTRPRISPPIENSYLELTDLPVGLTQKNRPWFMESPSSSTSYYSDLDLSKRPIAPACCQFQHPQQQ